MLREFASRTQPVIFSGTVCCDVQPRQARRFSPQNFLRCGQGCSRACQHCKTIAPTVVASTIRLTKFSRTGHCLLVQHGLHLVLGLLLESLKLVDHALVPNGYMRGKNLGQLVKAQGTPVMEESVHG